MKSLVILCAIIAVSAAVADDKAQNFGKQEKRHAYNGGTVQPASPGAATVPNNVPVQPYQPNNNNYLPTCVIQPYVNPSLPYYNGPTDSSSYVPQYQPSQYPVPYQPSQYPATYRPSQYPAPYWPSQYPVPYQYPVAYQPSSSQYPAAGYQPQQSPNPAAAPYSFSYFTSSANNNAESVSPSVQKK